MFFFCCKYLSWINYYTLLFLLGTKKRVYYTMRLWTSYCLVFSYLINKSETFVDTLFLKIVLRFKNLFNSPTVLFRFTLSVQRSTADKIMFYSYFDTSHSLTSNRNIMFFFYKQGEIIFQSYFEVSLQINK